jgi:outer membrane protein
VIAAGALVGGICLASTGIAGEAGGFVGLGVGYAPDYEGSEDYEAAPALFGAYNWASGRSIELGGAPGSGSAARLSSNLISESTSSTWRLGPLLQYRMERDDVDNNKVDRMEDIDGTAELGAFVGFKQDRLSAELSFAADVGDEYDGYLVYLKGDYAIPVNDSFKLKLGAHLSYADSNYMDTYFGVSSRDATRSGLSRFNADSGLKDWGLSLTGNYSINKSWGLMGVVAYNRLMNDAEDSPLVNDVGDENQFKGTIAVTYAF